MSPASIGGPTAHGPRPKKPPWTFTVRDALELEIFGRAQARVVAGTDHLDNVVRWVHSAEIRDIAQFLTGGELLLTAGSGVGRTDQVQRTFIRSLVEVGVSALAIELSGRVFVRMPEAVIDEANDLGLPIIAFGREIPFVQVAAQVHSCLVDLRVQELLEDELANAAFTDLLMEGEDSLSMVAELARRLGQPCILEDRAHQIRAYYGRTANSDAVVGDWDQHSRTDHQSDDLWSCTRETVAVKGDAWGWLHVLHDSDTLSSSGHYSIGRAAAAVAISLLTEEVRGVRRSQRAGALINRMMTGDITGDSFVERAVSLGRNFGGKTFMVLVAGVTNEGSFGETEMSQSLARVSAPALVTDLGDTTMAVVGLSGRKGEEVLLDALRQLPARVGVSRVVPARQLRSAVQQANHAYAAASAHVGSAKLTRFEDLGVLRLLMVLSEGPELASYVEDELGRVLEHDAASANKLFPTLRAFLECDGRKSQAAAQLFVQRRTLYYRLDRLTELLGHSLDEPSVRQRLQLAVRGFDLLNRRGPTLPSPASSQG